MSVRTHWSAPEYVELDIVEKYVDQYGSELDEGNLGLLLAHEEEVFLIEGDLDEFEELADRIKTLVQNVRQA